MPARWNEHSITVAIAAATAGLVGLTGWLNAPLGVLALIGILRVAAATVSPLGVAGATIVVLPWFYHPMAVRQEHLAASELLLAAAIAGCALRAVYDAARADVGGLNYLVDRTSGVVRSRLFHVLIVLTVVGLILSMVPFASAHRGAALREWRWTLLEPTVFVALILFVAGRRDWKRWFLGGCLIAAGSLAALSGAIDLATGVGVQAEGVRRIAGPYPHANALALFLLRTLVLALVVWIVEPRCRRWLSVPVVVMGMALLATFSRGALAAAAIVTMLAVGVAAPRLRWASLAVVAAGGLALALLASGRMLDAFGGGSASLRIAIWRSALAMIRDRPLAGYGPDGFLYAYTPRYVAPLAWAERFTSHAHDVFLDFWIRLGIIGGAFAVVAAGYLVVSTVAFVRTRGTRDALANAALLALFASLLHGSVDNAYFAHDLAMSAWLLAWLAFDERSVPAGKGASAVARPRRRWIGVHRVASLR